MYNDNVFPQISKGMNAHFRKCEKYTEYSEEIRDTPFLVEWCISLCSFSMYMYFSEFFFFFWLFFFFKIGTIILF